MIGIKKVSEHQLFTFEKRSYHKKQVDSLLFHEDEVFLYVLEGKVDIRIDEHTHYLKTGQMLYIPMGTFYHCCYEANTILLCLTISSKWIHRQLPVYYDRAIQVDPTQLKTKRKEYNYKQLIEDFLYINDHFKVNESQLAEFILDFIKQLIIKFNEGPAEGKPYYYKRQLNRIYKYIYLHYDEDLTIKSITEGLGEDDEYISRIYRHVFPGTLKKKLNRIRTYKAAFEIEYTEMTLFQISESCGFATTSGFYSAFKQFYYYTPRDYLRKYRLKEEGYFRPWI